jgi:hypothetical protein
VLCAGVRWAKLLPLAVWFVGPRMGGAAEAAGSAPWLAAAGRGLGGGGGGEGEKEG